MISIQSVVHCVEAEKPCYVPPSALYRRTTSKDLIDGVGEVITYGVSYEAVGRLGSRTSVSVSGISEDKTAVDALITRLIQNNASPIHLQELAEDYVAELSYCGL